MDGIMPKEALTTNDWMNKQKRPSEYGNVRIEFQTIGHIRGREISGECSESWCSQDADAARCVWRVLIDELQNRTIESRGAHE
jgi:hypothetical protein